MRQNDHVPLNPARVIALTVKQGCVDVTTPNSGSRLEKENDGQLLQATHGRENVQAARAQPRVPARARVQVRALLQAQARQLRLRFF